MGPMCLFVSRLFAIMDNFTGLESFLRFYSDFTQCLFFSFQVSLGRFLKRDKGISLGMISGGF
jgi:hypothetical protein